jgi:small-conductance mechanosensitive channel
VRLGSRTLAVEYPHVDWGTVIVAAVVIVLTLTIAKLVDTRMARRKLAPAAQTRYRVLRRTITAVIVFVGVMAALLTIPEVRATAGAILASSAVIGVVVGLAAQRTLSNFISGVAIALAQPLRLGDRVAVGDSVGTVEEIGSVYTYLRRDDGARFLVPNDRLASDTILNSTIVSQDKVAVIKLQLPLAYDVAAAVDVLRRETADLEGAEVFVEALEGNASVVVRVPADSPERAEKLERDLRLRAHSSLRAEGMFA